MMEGFSNLYVITIICFLILAPKGCLGIIGCFMCSSRNGSNHDCEDPFNATTASYVEKCKVPRRNRDGEFPAHFCVKLVGDSYDTGERVTIRRCVLENMDSQYGDFKWDEKKFKGWILTCATDGCNGGNSMHSLHMTFFERLLFVAGSVVAVSELAATLFHFKFHRTCSEKRISEF